MITWIDYMKRLRSVRLSQGRSLSDMAFVLGTSSSYLSNAENGKVKCSFDFACRYSNALGYPIIISGMFNF